MKTYNTFKPLINNNIIETAFILIFFLFSMPVFSKQEILSPKSCIEIKSSLQRLTCFDRYFKTPIDIPNIKEATKTLRRKKSKIMQMAIRIEEQRNDETAPGLLREVIMEHENAEQQRIILTSPALGRHPPRPLLMISCINNITRLQIGLHNSINRGRVDVALKLRDRTQQTNYSWRVLDDGKIIDAGHGIPSINLLKTMIGHNRILIHSEDIALEGLTFDITGFTHHVKSFRIACHW